MEWRLNVVAACVTLGLFVLWFAMLNVVRPSDDAVWINSLYQIKEAAARRSGPKVLLVGGSATHFSFSAELVSKASGLRVVNFGTHAALGARYLLYRARRSLRPGDTAVVSLEYPLLRSDTPGQILVGYVVFFDRGYVFQAGTANWLPLAFGLGPLELLKSQLVGLLPHGDQLYGPETVTELGDETRGAEAVDERTRERLRTAPPIDIWPVLREGPPASLTEFSEWARANHVTVLYVWTPTIYREVYSLPQFVGFFAEIRELCARLGIKTLGSPSEYFLPFDEMLDTPYHANTKGQAVASMRLSADLCHVLQCPKAVRDLQTSRPDTFSPVSSR